MSKAANVNPEPVRRPLKVIAVTGGKGGVGKSNLSVNLSIALAKQNQKVLLFDADLGLANVDVLLGLHPQKNLQHVIAGECDLKDIVLEGPEGVRIVPSASGISSMADMSVTQRGGVIAAFNELAGDTDILIIDTAAGVSSSVLSFCLAAQDILVVVCNEPTSITDAYALIKVLSQEHKVQRFHIISNMVGSQDEGLLVFEKLQAVADRFLEVTMSYLGSMPFEKKLIESVRMQKPLVEAFPNSKGARSIRQLADAIGKMPAQHSTQGGMTFFMERLFNEAETNR